MTGEELMQMMAALRFEHQWLGDDFVAESIRLGKAENGKEHHYVPQMYLKRWTVGQKVQPVLVDRRKVLPTQRPREVAKKTNFYSLPAPGGTMDAPLRWVEKHLSRIEDECAHRLDQLQRLGSGEVTDDELKRDLSVFLGLQVTRTRAQRTRYLLLIKGPVAAKREFYRLMAPNMTDADFRAMLARTHADPQAEAIRLMFSDVRCPVAARLHMRQWAVYRTETPLVTCDDPVVLVAGPPVGREVTIGVGFSAVVLYPIGPHQLLVMLRPGLGHRGGYVLDEEETRSINHEMVAAAESMVFERPGDDIAADLEVPTRADVGELSDEQAADFDPVEALQVMLRGATARSRWAGLSQAPAWPIPRWYLARTRA